MQQSPQDRRAAFEREVGDDLERLGRQPNAPGVALDHVRKAAAEVGRQLTLDLDGNHARARAYERGGQGAGAGPEVEHEVAARDAGGANQIGSEPATAEEVPTASALCSRTDGHGRPPCP